MSHLLTTVYFIYELTNFTYYHPVMSPETISDYLFWWKYTGCFQLKSRQNTRNRTLPFPQVLVQFPPTLPHNTPTPAPSQLSCVVFPKQHLRTLRLNENGTTRHETTDNQL